MYNETGTKIKKKALTSVMFEIGCYMTIGVILFVIFWANILPESKIEMPGWMIFAFLIASIVIGIGGSILAWNKYLLLAGFGELIESSTNTAKELAEIKQILVNDISENKEDISASSNIEEVTSSS